MTQQATGLEGRQVLSELARVKAIFQLRAIAAHIQGSPLSPESTRPPQEHNGGSTQDTPLTGEARSRAMGDGE